MTPVTHLVMFGWIPVVIGLFSRLKPRHAVIVSFIFAWLFLPNAVYPIKGLPDYTKMSATCWGILIAAAIFDHENLSSFRFRQLDLPMLVWCLCPVASSLVNGYGLYDGLAMALKQTVNWGLPYFIGRVYFSSAEGLKELAIGVFIGGLIYVPLCLYEMRFSPQLHRMVYGFHQHSFAQTRRWGGWRPMVFLTHGLMLGVWMMSSTLIGAWLWRTGVLKDLGSIPMKLAVPVLMLTTVLCRSTGAVAQLMMGMAVLTLSRWLRSPLLLFLLVAVPLVYIPARATNAWTGHNLVSFIERNISQERADSLKYRMANERILSEKALEHPVFGWGTWGKARVYDDQGKDISITDGLWVIALGNHGLVGLASLVLSILMPAILFLRRSTARLWDHPSVAPATVLSLLLALYMVDCLLNAMINPIFMVMAGGVTGMHAFEPEGAGEAQVNPPQAARAPLVYAPRFL